MKVINFGSMNIDQVYKVPDFVRPGETLQSESLEINPGGKGLNQSIAIRRAGQEVYHAGIYGQDGAFLKAYLEENQVQTKYLTQKDVKQGHAMIQVDASGENSILLYEGSNGALKEEDIDAVFQNLEKGDWLVLQNEVNGLDYIVEKAYEKACHIIFNPAPMNEKALAIDLSKIDWLIVNEIEGQALSAENEAEAMIQKLSEAHPELNIIITLGSKGSLCWSASKTYYQEAIPSEVRDTTGAGDTFIGYFVAGLLAGLSISDNLQKASVASSLCIAKEGAAPSIPYEKEVLDQLKGGNKNE